MHRHVLHLKLQSDPMHPSFKYLCLIPSELLTFSDCRSGTIVLGMQVPYMRIVLVLCDAMHWKCGEIEVRDSDAI